MVRAREVLDDEEPEGPSKHLVLRGKIRRAYAYGPMASSYGILADRVEPEMLDLPAAGVGEPDTGVRGTARARSQLWPKYFAPRAPKIDERTRVIQLWGLTHCVNPALDRLAAMVSMEWTMRLRMGVKNARNLRKEDFAGLDSATVSELSWLLVEYRVAYSLVL